MHQKTKATISSSTSTAEREACDVVFRIRDVMLRNSRMTRKKKSKLGCLPFLGHTRPNKMSTTCVKTKKPPQIAGRMTVTCLNRHVFVFFMNIVNRCMD